MQKVSFISSRENTDSLKQTNESTSRIFTRSQINLDT